MPSRVLTALAVLAAAAAVGGCGLGAGHGTGGVSVAVTQAFGSRSLGSVSKSQVPGSETVMRMLERSFRVQTRYGGGFVQSIDGHAGNSSQTDWFYYINGLQAPKGAATTPVHRGDRIWWDLHDWRATDSIPAVVGSFPEPFVHGQGGKRFPTTLECGANVDRACKLVTAALDHAGVPVASQLIGTGSGPGTLAVVVGTWGELHTTVAASLIEKGPSASGIYARFTPTGSQLQLLNPRGQVARTLTAGAGLVAATSDEVAQPTWLITGTNPAGVAAAAAALTPAALHNHFALALDGSTRLPIPLQSGQ